MPQDPFGSLRNQRPGAIGYLDRSGIWVALNNPTTAGLLYNASGNAAVPAWSSLATIAGLIDHHLLADLTGNDDHTQYALLAGRSGAVDFTANVGIGVATPSYPLQIGGTSNTNNLAISSATSMLGYLGVYNDIAVFAVNRDIQAGTFANTSRTQQEIRLVSANGSGSIQFFTTNTNNTGAAEAMRIAGDGKVGIGVTPAVELAVYASTSSRLHLQSSNSGTTATDGFQLAISTLDAYVWNYENGPIHFATNNTEYATLSAAGAWRWQAYGVGTITSDASGNLTAVSDMRLKTREREVAVGREALLDIHPFVGRWNEQSGLDGSRSQVFISAQEVQKHLPEAVGQNSEGYLTLDDRGVLALLIKGFQEQDAEITTLRAQVSSLEERLARLEAV